MDRSTTKGIGMTDRRKSFEQQAHRLNRAARNAIKDRGAAWYAIFVISGREMQVQRALKSWPDVRCFLPLRRKWRRVNRYSQEQAGFASPAIPGCLIVGVPGACELFEIVHALDSVYGVLGVGGEAVALDPDKLAEFVRGNKFACDGSISAFKVGDRVVPMEGLLSNRLLEIEAVANGSAYFTVQLLGSSTQFIERLDNLSHAA